MKSSSKQAAASSRMVTLHQRLYNALKLGCAGCSSKKSQNWSCTDLEIQKLVIRSIDAFLDCISVENPRNPLVKDSVDDMLRALEMILQFQSESVLDLASGVAAKMVNVLPSSMFQSHFSHLVCPLSSLLCSQKLQVAISCATALNIILSNLTVKQEKELWEILKERNAVSFLINNVNGFNTEDQPIEYFQEMAFLLSKILWRWPPSRFSVWSDSKLLNVIDSLGLKLGSSLRVAILQLYSSLALCFYGAKRLLENGRNLVLIMVESMNSFNPLSIQLEGFKLAQTLMANEHGCTEVMKLCCEPLVNLIIKQMSDSHLYSGKPSKDQMSLVLVVCRLALITRWTGNHQNYFWKAGICRALLVLLLNNFAQVDEAMNHMTLQEQMNLMHKVLKANSFPSLKPYIWDILGGLAANCEEDFDPMKHGAEIHLNILILCACLAFLESINMACQISHDSSTNKVFGSESASRSVLMMVYSPSKYIASQTRSLLSKVLELNRKDYIECMLNILNATSCNKSFGIPGNLQITTSLVSLLCYACLPNYGKHITDLEGIRILLIFLKWWLANPLYVKRSTIAPHLHDSFTERTCCIPCGEDWDGEDMLLLFCLWALAELINHLGSCSVSVADNTDFDRSQLIEKLKEIHRNNYSPGSRWYAAYLLSHFGLYGFPNKFGERIGKEFMEKNLADLSLNLMDQEVLPVHKVILVARCSSLLPQKEQFPRKELNVTLSKQEPERSMRSITEVRLSARVDHQSLLKILEYVYFGYLQADEDLLKKLKVLAKHCDMKLLLHVLRKQNPRWGTPIPIFDLTCALGPAGHDSSDILLESNTTQLHDWRCGICSASTPHFHVHKVILRSGCDYFDAVFHSGMQESISPSMKVPVTWESLVKLITWLYSNMLPKPMFGCLWVNLDISKKINELHPYIELCWLAEFWLLEDLHEQCFKVVVSAMETDVYLSIEVIQLAAHFSQWKLAEAAANYMAPSYNQLRSSGDLDQLDEGFIEMARVASVQLSQKEFCQL